MIFAKHFRAIAESTRRRDRRVVHANSEMSA
jgi:hypothetical protein